MDNILSILDFFIHIDKHLDTVIQTYGTWTYGLLFLIVFCETGLVVTPILPGDSLLFAAGAFAGRGALELDVLIIVLLVAAVVGDAVNYHIGSYLGPKIFQGDSRIFKKQYLDHTQRFYEKYGGKTIIIARFVPIVRTFAPCFAGAGKMGYMKFLAYNGIGALLWVGILVPAGYLFSEIPIVKNNFSLVILGIIIVSVLPAVYEVVMARRKA